MKFALLNVGNFVGMWTFAEESDDSDMLASVATVLIFVVNSAWLCVVLMVYFQGRLVRTLDLQVWDSPNFRFAILG